MTLTLLLALPSSARPDIAAVGALIRARTRDENGTELGTFTDQTRPTEAEVSVFIDQAMAEVFLRIPLDNVADLGERLLDYALYVVAIRAAMAVELSYHPDRTEEGSAYGRLRELFEQAMTALMALADTTGADDTPYGDFASIPIKSPTNPDYVYPTVP